MYLTQVPGRIRLVAGLFVGALAPALGITSALAQDAVWQQADIGAVAAAGSSEESGGVAIVRGSGEDIWGNNDEFHFRYRAWTGDGVLIARVDAITFTHAWAKAGLMIRSDLTTGSPHAFVGVNPNRIPFFAYRDATAGITSMNAAVQSTDQFPQTWVRLTRSGNTITAEFSPEGIAWRSLGNQTMALPATVYIGLAVTSHADGVICTANFQHFAAGLGRPVNLTGIARSRTRVQLQWTDNENDETYEIERSTDNASGFVLIGTTAGMSFFADTTASPDTTYYYRVRSLSPRGPSLYTNVAAVTTPPPPPPGWDSKDIGDTSLAGYSRLSGSVFSVTGAGVGVGGVTYSTPTVRGQFGIYSPGFSDEFHFLWKSWSGEGEIVARITGLSSTNTGHAGVMVRTSDDPSAFNVFSFLKATGTVGVTGRVGTGTSYYEQRATRTLYNGTAVNAGPTWLKLVRLSDGVLSYQSTDGVNWTYLAWVAVPLTPDVQFGLGVSSQQDAPPGAPPSAPPSLLTGSFDNVTIGPISTAVAVPTPPTDFRAIDVRQSYIHIGWTNPVPYYDGEELQESSDGVNFTTVGTWGREFYSNSTINGAAIQPDTDYYFRLRTRRGAAVSSWTDVLRVHTTRYPSPPSNLTATAVSASQVNFTWTDNASNEDYHVLERSTDNVNFVYAALAARNTTSYSLTGLSPSTTYYFRLYAHPYDWANPAYSNTATARTSSGAPPPTNLVATAASATRIDLTWSDRSSNESGFQLDRSTDGTNFTQLATFPANTESHSDATVNGSTTYYYRIRASNVDHEPSAYSNVAQATTPPTPPTGPVWQHRDIGDVAAAGSQTESGSTVTLTGSGADIWNTADEFRYRFQPWTGDGEIIARVTGLTNTHGWAKAGLMFRETLQPGSRHAWMCVSIAHGTAFQYRATTGGESGSAPASEAGGVPRWVRLVRSGNTFTGYESTNGTTWTQSGTTTLTGMPATIYIGLAVTSHNDGVTSTATFDNISVGGAGAPPPPPPSTLPAPSMLSAFASSSTQIDLTWNDNSSDETGFTVERSTDGTNFTAVTTVGPNIRAVTNSGLTSSTTYHYRVYATRGTTVSAHSNTTNATTRADAPPPAAPTGLSATAVLSNRIDLSWTDNASDETLYTIERSTDNVAFGHVMSFGPNTTAASDTTVVASTTYYYRVFARNNGLVSSFSNTASATTPSASTPPPAGVWQSQDVGAVGAPGSASESGGRVTLTGSGADIWNMADEFRYRYQQWNGDGEIVAQVVGLSNTDGWAKAAVMFRESLNADSRHATMIVSIGHGTALQYRTVTGGETGSTAPSESGGFRQWLRLVRSGTTFTGYSSLDGATWTLAGTITLPLPTTVFVGLAVTSHNDGTLCTATFENVTLVGGGPPTTSPPAAPSGLTATSGSASQINVAWTDASSNETGFEVESSRDNVNFTLMGSRPAGATTASHTGLNASTLYYYRVRAVNGSGPSAYSNVASATTQAAPPPPPSTGAWQSADIGAVAGSGSTNDSTSGGIWLTGTGADIWNLADEFRYRYQTLTGAGEIVTRLTSLSDTHGWAKAGVMIRETLNADSRHVFMCVSVAHGTAFQYRTTTGGETGSSPPSESGGVPRWVRLVRNGSTFTGHVSVDGVNWTQAGTLTLDLPATVYIGQAVTSHNDGVFCTATFENTSVTGGATPPPSTTVNAPTGLTANVVSSSQINLSWSDNSSNETAFHLERSTDNMNFASILTAGANQTSYSNVGLNAATTYYYRVRAAAGSTPSGYSNVAMGTTAAGAPPAGAWSSQDIGTVGVTGSHDASGNAITVRGSGADVWDTTDGFRMVYRSITGDCTVEAQVSSMGNTHTWAKAGVMIRESVAANARNVFAFLTPTNGLSVQARSATGGATSIASGPWWVDPPYWVRLVRVGGRITSFSSPDGSTWTQVAAYDIAMGTTVLVGFAVTSHDNSVLNTAVFTDPFIQ